MSNSLMSPLVAAVALAWANHGAPAMAQVRHQPSPLLSAAPIGQGPAVPAPEAAALPKTGPVKRQMPVGHMPILTTPRRVFPIQLENMRGLPWMGTTEEGRVHYFYEGERLERLAQEQIGFGDDIIVGHYFYDRDGRFERIEYEDGVIITAHYGDKSQLLTLTSNEGRTIGFGYYTDENGNISTVTPTQNFLEFHSAVHLLRLPKAPAWWPAAMDRAIKKIGDDGPTPDSPANGGGPQYPPSPWPDAIPYPDEAFPGAPKTPQGTPIVTINASPLPPPPPSYTNGVEIVPIGGPTELPPRKGGGIIVGEIKDGKDLANEVANEELCNFQRTSRLAQIREVCHRAPTFADRMDCLSKSADWNYHAQIGCSSGDFHFQWEKLVSPEMLNFAPWLPKPKRYGI